MLKSIRSNPILDQTMRASRYPSLWVSLGILAVLSVGSIAARAWLTIPLTGGMRGTLLRLDWLLPLVTMIIASALTAGRMGGEPFQLIRQSPLSDRQVVWGLGLSSLYTLRVVLVLALGLLPLLATGGPWDSLGQIACLAGLHLVGAMIGAALTLRWGRERLGVILTGMVSISVIALLAMIDAFVPDAFGVDCVRPGLRAMPIMISAFLAQSGGARPFLGIGIALVSMGAAWASGLIPWRGESPEWRPAVEMLLGGTLAIAATLGMAVTFSRDGERPVLVAVYHATDGEDWPEPLNDSWSVSPNSGGWMTDQPYCTWGGVACVCGRVVDLDLSYQHRKGPLPVVITDLTSLQHITLISNEFSAIPPEIARLTNLKSLVMINNSVSEVPPEMSRMTSLKYADFLYNPIEKLPPGVCNLPHFDPWPEKLCDYIQPLPATSPEMTVPLEDGTHACGLATMAWGSQALDLDDYPACQSAFPAVTVHCLDDKAQWNDDGIHTVETSPSARMILVESERTGICGIFPTK